MNIPAAPSPLRIVALPRLAAAGRWRVEAMRSISEPCLLWFTKGQGRITLAGTTKGYTAHNAIYIPAGVMHGFEVGPSVFGQAVFFGRDGAKEAEKVLPATPLHLRIREVHAQQEMNQILEAIQKELDTNAPGAERAARHHLGLLVVWLERQAAKAASEAVQPDAARRLVARYTALLERDFRTGMGVGDFATALGVTPTHLSRCCRIANGHPASVLLQDRKLFEARKLLAETRLPVKQVGESLGFSSPAYFTRAFQTYTGKSPTAFRRSP